MTKYYNSKVDKFTGCISAFSIFLVAMSGVGWVMNIVKIFQSANDPITGVFILRCVGTVIAPIGAILGWF